MRKVGVSQKCSARVIRAPRNRGQGMKLAIGGRFDWKIIRDGSIYRAGFFHNDVTDEGLNHILDSTFGNSTQITVWYIGFIRDDNFSELANADTMSSHAGWEEGDEYSEATRREWVDDAAGGGIKTNSVAAEFSINATETMKGLFISSLATKNGTTGILWATGLFSEGDQSVNNGDTLAVTYTLTVARA